MSSTRTSSSPGRSSPLAANRRSLPPKSVVAAHEEVLERRGAFISLSGREDLEAFRGVDAGRQSRSLLSRLERLDFFYQNIYTNRIPWCVAAGAAPGTAAAVFPGLSAGEALAALWDRIFSVCHVYEPDPMAGLARPRGGPRAAQKRP